MYGCAVPGPAKGKSTDDPAIAQDDERLMGMIAGGDRNALGSLYDRYAGVLCALAERLLGGKREAQDLVHDVFLEVWRSAGDYDRERGTVRGWILLRLRSRALDRIKSPGHSRAVALEDTHVREEAASDEDPALAPDRAAVRRALETLPPEQRGVVELAYFEGLSSTEIAERLSVPVGTVKSRVAAAMSKLRHELAVSPGGAH
jgi:RNA polymerase sigma-70 factor (ECF subfamily)